MKFGDGGKISFLQKSARSHRYTRINVVSEKIVTFFAFCNFGRFLAQTHKKEY